VSQTPSNRSLYEPLKNEAMLAHAEFQMWDQLYATHPDRVAILNATAGGFFAMLSPVVADNVMMRLSRLTDAPATGRHRNLTLRDLVAVLKSSFRPADSIAYQSKLDDLHAVCESMRVQRNKRLAHLDFNASAVDGADPLPGVRVSDIRRALVLLQEALNIFERNQDFPTVMYSDFMHTSGSVALLGALKRTLAYKKHVTDGTIDPRKDDLRLAQREQSGSGNKSVREDR
jgi:hypothetical protein